MDTPDPYGEAPTRKRHALTPDAPEAAAQAAWERTVLRDILVGRKLGDYVVTHRIGAGGMGMVYAAEEPRIGRKVAIKVLRPDRDDNRGLLDEARNSNAVRHRGIVDVYAFGELPGIGQYLVMEYLEGKPLDQVLTERGSFPAVEALPILDEVVAALDAAHSRGVVHRDLKPSNIFLIDEAGGARYAKILDFGLAKKSSVPGDLAHQTRVSAVVGTPHYMAPEQAMGKPVGPKTDLYAVGIIAFELLTGDIPFNGASPMEIAIKQVNDAPPAPNTRAPMPDGLNDLILSLLQKDPEARPGAASVRQALRRIHRELAAAATQLGGPIRELRPVSVPSPQRPAKPAREAAPSTDEVPRRAPSTVEEVGEVPARSRVLPFAGAALVVAALSAGGFFVLRGDAPEPRQALAADRASLAPAPMRLEPEPDAPPPAPPEVKTPTPSGVPTAAREREGAPVGSPADSDAAAGGDQGGSGIAAADAVGSSIQASSGARETEDSDRRKRRDRPGPPPSRARVTPAAEARGAEPAPAMPGKLTVNVVGGVSAEVFVDGESVGWTPLIGREVPAGRHTVRIALRNGVSHEQPVAIPSGGGVKLTKWWDAQTRALRDLRR